MVDPRRERISKAILGVVGIMEESKVENVEKERIENFNRRKKRNQSRYCLIRR